MTSIGATHLQGDFECTVYENGDEARCVLGVKTMAVNSLAKAQQEEVGMRRQLDVQSCLIVTACAEEVSLEERMACA